jgi:hypothetical protein
MRTLPKIWDCADSAAYVLSDARPAVAMAAAVVIVEVFIA